MTPQQIKGSFLPVKFTKENIPHLTRVCLSAILPGFSWWCNFFCDWPKKKANQLQGEDEENVKSWWRASDQSQTGTRQLQFSNSIFFAFEMFREWWGATSTRISCFLSTSIRRLFLIYLWRLSGNLSLLSFLPVPKTNEIIPVSGCKFALVAGTVTPPFDLGQTVCPTL